MKMIFLRNKKKGVLAHSKDSRAAQKNAQFFLLLFFLVGGALWLLSSGMASRASSAIAAPVWRAGRSAAAGISINAGAIFFSKLSLQKENEDLRRRVQELEKNLLGFDLVFQENLDLKKILGRDGESVPPKNLLLAGVLADPRGLPYDIFSVDAGSANGVREGSMVLAGFSEFSGFSTLNRDATSSPSLSLPVAAGKVIDVFGRTARVRLFSSAGEKTPVFLGPDNIATLLIGEGGGAFTAELPKEADIRKGDTAVLPGVLGYFAAVVEEIESDASSAFQKIYLRVPFNPAQLRYVALPLDTPE